MKKSNILAALLIGSIAGLGADKAQAEETEKTTEGRLVVQSGETREVTGETYDNKGGTSITDGGAALNAGTLTITKSYFTNNSAENPNKKHNNGGAIYNAASGILKIYDSYFENNKVEADTSGNYTALGGAIYNAAGGKVEISNTLFSGNTVKSLKPRGAAIHSSGEMTITGSTFIKNDAINSNGTLDKMAGILYNSEGTLNLNNNTFGGDDYTDANKGNSLVHSNRGTVYLSGNTFKYNIADKEGIFNPSGTRDDSQSKIGSRIFFNDTNSFLNNKGSAIFNWQDAQTTFNDGSITKFIENSVLEDKDNKPYGAGIYNTNIVTFKDGASAEFTGNKAKSGGAVYNNSSGTMTLANTKFTSNEASEKGGAIYNAGTMTIKAANSDVTFSGNTAAGAANDIYNTGDLTLFADTSKKISLTGGITGAAENKGTLKITGAGSIQNSGAIQNQNVTVTDSGTLKLTSGAIADASRIVVDSGANLNADSAVFTNANTAENGGAVYNAGTLNITGTYDGQENSVQFKSNTTTKEGSAIYNTGNLVIDRVTFEANNVTNDAGEINGGTIYSSANLTIRNSLFKDNSVVSTKAAPSATRGAAVYNYYGAAVIENTDFDGNYAIGRPRGAAVYNNGGTMTITGGSFTNNYAKNMSGASDGMGSAIYNGETGKLTLEGVTFDNNSGLSIISINNNASGAFTLNDGNIFKNNKPTKEGVLNFQPQEFIANVNGHNEFLNNSGSAIYVYGGTQSPAVVFNSGSSTVFSGNEANIAAGNTSGGAIFNGGTVTFADGSTSTFTGNSAAQGGAVYNAASGTMTIADAQFTGNKASTGEGGAIYNAGTMTIKAAASDVTFTENTADGSANDIYNTGDLTLFADTSKKISLTGGITGAAENKGTLKITGAGSIQNSGAIQNQNVTISDSGTLKLNSGAIADASRITVESGAKLTSADGITFQNGSGTNGGAVYTNGGAVVLGDNVTFKNNSASGDGNDVMLNGGSFTAGDNFKIIHETAPAGDCDIYAINGASVTIGNDTVFNGGGIGDGIVIAKDSGSERSKLIIGDNASFSNYGDAAIIVHNGADAVIGQNAVFDNTNLAIQNSRGSVTQVGDGAIVKNAGHSQWGAFLNRASDGGDDTTVLEFLGKVTVQDNNNTGLYNRLGAKAIFDGEALFSGNNTVSGANGGAVRNVKDSASYISTVTFNDSASFTNNTASNLGGAIYNEGIVNFNSNASFSGNKANGAANDIYNLGTINFNAADDTTNTISLKGGIDGTTSGIINIAGAGTNKSGVVDIQGNIHNQTVNVNSGELHLSAGAADGSNLTGSTVNTAEGAVLNTIDGAVNNYTGAITLADGAKVKADADLTDGSEKIDNYSLAAAGGTITLDELKILNEFDKTSQSDKDKTLTIASGANVTISDNVKAYTSNFKYTAEGNTAGNGQITIKGEYGKGGLNAAVADTSAAKKENVVYTVTENENFKAQAKAADETVQKANFTIEGSGKTITADNTPEAGNASLAVSADSNVTINNVTFKNFEDTANGAVNNKGALNLKDVTLTADDNEAGIVNSGTVNIAGASKIGAVKNSGVLNADLTGPEETAVIADLSNAAGAQANINSGIVREIYNDPNGEVNIAEAASAGFITNDGNLNIKIIDNVDEVQNVNTLISNASQKAGSGDTTIDLQLSDHSAAASDGVKWNLTNALVQNSVTFTGDGHLTLSGAGGVKSDIINRMTGNTLVINTAVEGNFVNDDTDSIPHAILGEGSSVSGTITNDGILDITASSFNIKNGITDEAGTGAAGTLNIGGGTNAAAVTLESGEIAQQNLNILSNGSLTAGLADLTIGSGAIANAGALNLTGAGSINYDITGAGETAIDAGEGNSITFDTNSNTIANTVNLKSGTFKVTGSTVSGSEGNVTFTGIKANGGELSVQDNSTGTIALGTVDLTNADLKIAIDTDLTAAAQKADVISSTAAPSGTKKIVISGINAMNYTAGSVDVNIADANTKSVIDMSNTSIIGNIGNLMLTYTASTGNITSSAPADLKEAITSNTGAGMYAMSGNETITGDAALGGESLSITANNNTITGGGDNSIKTTAAAQTLSVTKGAITGFDTAIDNSAGGTVNLTDVTMTGNSTADVNNAGALNLAGTNAVNKITGAAGTANITDGKTTVSSEMTQSAVNIADGAELDNKGALTAAVTNAGTLTNEAEGAISGAIANNGALDNAGTIAAGNTVTNAADALITNTGTIAAAIDNTAGGNVIQNSGTISGAVNNSTGSGTIAVNGGTISGAINNTGSGSSVIVNNGTVSGDIDNTNNLASSALIVRGGTVEGDITNIGGKAVIEGGTVSGDIDNKDGNLAVSGGTVSGDISSTGGGTAAISGGTVSGNITSETDLTVDGGTVSGDVTVTGGTMDVNSGVVSGAINNTAGGALTIDGGTVSGAVDNSGTGTLAVSGGTVSGDINNAGTGGMTVSGGAVSGNINNAGGTLNVSGGALTGAISGAAGNAGAINVTGNAAITGALTDQNLTVAGVELVSSAASLSDASNNVNLNGGAGLNIADGQTGTVNAAVVSDGTANVKLDVDVSSGAADKFTNVTGAIAAEVKTMGAVPYNGTSINLTAATGLPASSFADAELGTVLTPIRYLNGAISQGILSYAPKGGRNDYETFNPAVTVSEAAAQAGAYLSQLESYNQAFGNMDMYMLMTQKERTAAKFANKYAAMDGDNVFDLNANIYRNKAAWFRPFASFERVPLKNGPDISNVSYGTYLGGDSDLHELGNGWDGQFSVYASYNGSHQAYQGNSIYLNGGNLGLTGTVYKGNFFAGLTANGGASAANAKTMYGSEDFTMITAGAALKTGYNWELAEGHFIIQPSYQMSYSFIDTLNYNNAAGLRIKSDPLHAITFEPGVKFIGNLPHGWQPYAGVSVIWNVLDKSDVKANDVSLPEMSIKPFVKWGFGVRKKFGDRFTGFLQMFFTHGGRKGVGFQTGLRWNLGEAPASNPNIRNSAKLPEKQKANVDLKGSRVQ